MIILLRGAYTKTDTRPSCETVKGVREDPIYVRSECPFLYANRKITNNVVNPHIY